MIKCLECGFESQRLQWTHFKFNCTGKFSNGTEYRASYPGAALVSSTVAKSTAVTLSNLIKKYGAVEGPVRWDQYKRKQAVTNSFEYKKEKHGWTREEFNEYNSSRAQTLEKMIERHGEAEGAAKWEYYCVRQAYTNTKAYFVNKYGLDCGTKKFLEINHKKSIPHCPILLAESLGITEDQATDIILARQTKFFTSNLEEEFTALVELEFGQLDNISARRPYGKWSQLLNTYVIYDIKHKNCIIEFNGDYWHANPLVYADTAIIRGKTAVEIRRRDMLKLKTAQDLGFKTLVIWESEFRENKQEIIKKVVKWILREQQ